MGTSQQEWNSVSWGRRVRERNRADKKLHGNVKGTLGKEKFILI